MGTISDPVCQGCGRVIAGPVMCAPSGGYYCASCAADRETDTDKNRLRRLLADKRPLPILPMPEEPTLRDQFAMSALSGVIVDYTELSWDEVAEAAYELADAMMKARDLSETGFREPDSGVSEEEKETPLGPAQQRILNIVTTTPPSHCGEAMELTTINGTARLVQYRCKTCGWIRSMSFDSF